MHSLHASSKLLVVATLALAACAGPYDDASEQAHARTEDGSDEPLAQAVLAQVMYNGTGCRSGTGSYSTSADGLMYTFRFPELSATSGTVDCLITLKPSDDRYGIYQVKYDGPVSVPAGTRRATVALNTYVQGSPTNSIGETFNISAPTSTESWSRSIVLDASVIRPGNGRALVATVAMSAFAGSSPVAIGGGTSKVTIQLARAR